MYDCYRPKQAVADFVQWSGCASLVLPCFTLLYLVLPCFAVAASFVGQAHTVASYDNDVVTKGEFYPTLNKTQLFPDYIATESGHSRGSTLDLTLV